MAKEVICEKCRCALQPHKVVFSYLGNSFDTMTPCCPKCGLIYVPEEVACGKMLEVETMLEDK